MGSIAFQLFVSQSLQTVEESFVRGISKNLETFPVSPDNLARKTSVIGPISFQAIELLIFEPNLHVASTIQELHKM